MSSVTEILHLVDRPQSPSEVLMYYDGPLAMWLESDDGRRFLAVAIGDDEGPWPFLLTELHEDEQEALEAQQLTLREAFLLEGHTRYLLPDYGAEELEVQVLDRVPDSWLPADVVLES